MHLQPRSSSIYKNQTSSTTPAKRQQARQRLFTMTLDHTSQQVLVSCQQW